MTRTDNPPQSARSGSRRCQMIVRAPEEVDVEPLAAIWFDGWHEAHASLVPESLVRLRTRKSFRPRLRFELDSVRLIGAPGGPLGFTMIHGEELYQFYVAASVRGSGIAAMLMKDVEGQMMASGVSIAWLACAVGNTRAARLLSRGASCAGALGRARVPRACTTASSHHSRNISATARLPST